MDVLAMEQRQLEQDIKQYEGVDPWQLADLLRKTMEEVRDISRAYSAMSKSDEPQKRAEARRDLRRKEWFQNVLRHRLMIDFGAQFGWKPSHTEFGLKTLSQGKMHGNMGYGDNPYSGSFHDQFDHPYYYRHERKAAAIAAHLYNYPTNRESCLELAELYNLRLIVPDFPSWWFPGFTTLVAYVGKGGEGFIPPSRAEELISI